MAKFFNLKFQGILFFLIVLRQNTYNKFCDRKIVWDTKTLQVNARTKRNIFEIYWQTLINKYITRKVTMFHITEYYSLTLYFFWKTCMTLNWQLVPFTNLLSGFQLLIVFLWKRFLKLPMVNQIFPSKSNIYEKYTWHYKELQLFVRFSLLFANSFGKEIRKRDTRRSTLESSHSNSPKTEYSGKKQKVLSYSVIG